MELQKVLNYLKMLGNPEVNAFKAKKFGIPIKNGYGIYMKDLNALVKLIKRDDDLALALFDSEIYEARILCSKILRPKSVTPELMEKWVKTFDNWEICDSFCMKLFSRTPYAVEKAKLWSKRTEEFEKRAGFVIMASYALADKKALNDVYESFFPIMIREANDERNFVKKAVNWSLRQIGKRNKILKIKAIETAYTILALDTKSARWIANDALRELQNPNCKSMDYPRSIYRPYKPR